MSEYTKEGFIDGRPPPRGPDTTANSDRPGPNNTVTSPRAVGRTQLMKDTLCVGVMNRHVMTVRSRFAPTQVHPVTRLERFERRAAFEITALLKRGIVGE